MCVRCGDIRSTVLDRPSSRKAASPSASNCSSAEPNTNPSVHCVQARVWYRPSTVNTGAPSAARHVASSDRILAAESVNRRAIFGSRSAGVRFLSSRIIRRSLARAGGCGKSPRLIIVMRNIHLPPQGETSHRTVWSTCCCSSCRV